MKKYITFFVLMFIAVHLFGQSREISLFISSYKVSGIFFTGVDKYNYDKGIYEINSKLFGCSLGYYIPFIHPSDNISLGVNVSGQVAKTFSTSSSNAMESIIADFSLPVTGTLRFGAGSGKNSTFPVGIGLGYGYRLNSMLVDGDIFKTNKDVLFQSIFRPYGFVEIVFDFHKRNRNFFENFKIQFAFQPKLEQNFFNKRYEDEQHSALEYFSVSFIKFRPFK